MQDVYSIHIRGADGTVQDIEFGSSSLPDIVTQTANNVIAFSSAGISVSLFLFRLLLTWYMTCIVLLAGISPTMIT